MVELGFILNRSGSSIGLEKDTIRGYNSMLEMQKNQPGEALVSTILFNNFSKVVQKRTPIRKVPFLTEKQFDVCGATALLDAIGGAVEYTNIVRKYAKMEEIPQKTLFVIATDGMENASSLYSYEKVRSLIEVARFEHGWEFLLLGANFDASEEARNLGIEESRAVRYRKDAIGKALCFEAINTAVSCVRKSMSISDSWKVDVEEDYRTRKDRQ